MAGRRAIILRTARLVLGVLVALPLLFALVGWIGSSIPRNADREEPDPASERTIAVMVGTNGVHTEIAMPAITPEMDWTTLFPRADIADPYRDYTHVAVSWGERRFFLETPSWSELDPAIAIGAAFGGEGVLHVAHYVRPAPAPDYRVLHLREAEYRALVAAIAGDLVENPEVLPGYGPQDVFYTARGTYHLGNTCNQWTSDRLAAAGVTVGLWSPFPGGVMKWVPRP